MPTNDAGVANDAVDIRLAHPRWQPAYQSAF
jgi:hypothetical protein